MPNQNSDHNDDADPVGGDVGTLSDRHTRVLQRVSLANKHLAAIKAAYPPGPPSAPDATTLRAIVTQSTQILATAHALLGTAIVPGSQ
jgi:hypothetical protein